MLGPRDDGGYRVWRDGDCGQGFHVLILRANPKRSTPAVPPPGFVNAGPTRPYCYHTGFLIFLILV